MIRCTKRIFSAFLMIVMLFSLSIVAFADESSNKGVQSTVYYPTSGSGAGTFYDAEGDWIYYTFPSSGTINISYSLDAPNGCTLEIYRKTGWFTWTKSTDVGLPYYDGSGHVTSFYIASGNQGDYKVRVVSTTLGYHSYALQFYKN